MNVNRSKANFPYESQYVQVYDSHIHYVDEGPSDTGVTFLLLHGNPTSSYLWRNIIPHLSDLGRVLVPDLIGFGRSGKPDIAYSYRDHCHYINAFIKALALDHITLVVQDWGSAIGFNYAVTHEANVDGIVFFEAITKPFRYNRDFTLWQSLLFRAMRHDTIGAWLNLRHGFFINLVLPMLAGRRLSPAEMSHYRAPFQTLSSRKPVWMFPREVSIDGDPDLNTRIINRYRQRLGHSSTPKLMFYTRPGLVLKYREARILMKQWPNLKAIYLGKGGHYLQEQYPDEIGESIVQWHQEVIKVSHQYN